MRRSGHVILHGKLYRTGEKERTPAKNLVGVGAVHRAISKEYQAQGCHYAED